MVRRTLIILFMLAGVFVHGQKIDLISMDELEKRIGATNDTTYVVNLWATWCAPCIKELPYFDKLQRAYKEEKLKVILVSVDFVSQLEKTVKPFIANKNFIAEIFLLNEKDQQHYIERIDKSWSGSIPATLLICGNKRRFLESELEYADLEDAYQTIKQ